jgi:lipopolysaccharide export system permease protein
MGTISRYMIREFLKILALTLLVFVFIYLTIDFLGRVDDFIEASVSVKTALFYLLCKIPYVVVQMLPPATMIGVVVLLSLMKRRNEIIALKGCGLNVLSVIRPLIVASFLLAAVLFLISEVLVPLASSRGNELWRIDVRKRGPEHAYAGKHIWYKGANAIYWIELFDGKNQVMIGPSFYFFDGYFKLIKKIDAKTAAWHQHHWELKDGIVQELKEDGNYALARFDRLILDIPETPEAFKKKEKKPEEMSYWHLKQFAERVRAEGYDATEYLVNVHLKLAFPFIVVIMVLMGTPVALASLKGGTPVAVSLGVALCFAYLVALGLCRSAGFAGILPPLLSAWLANGMFFFLGIHLMMGVER